MVSIKDLYWLAGMLEGEASFYTYSKINKYTVTNYPEITFQSNDYDIVWRVSKIINSNLSRVYAHKSSRTVAYKTRVCATKAAQWMMTIYSIMGERRKAKIKEVLSEWKLSVDGRGTISDSKWKRNKRIKDLKKLLNSQPVRLVINPFESRTH